MGAGSIWNSSDGALCDLGCVVWGSSSNFANQLGTERRTSRNEERALKSQVSFQSRSRPPKGKQRTEGSGRMAR